MIAVRLVRVLLGAAIVVAAVYLFEPSIFKGSLPPEILAAQMFRNVAGVGGAICGLLVIFDALFPKAKSPAKPALQPAPEPAPEPAPHAYELETVHEEPAIDPAVMAFRGLPALAPDPRFDAPANIDTQPILVPDIEPEPEPEPEPQPESVPEPVAEAAPAPAPDEEAAEPVWGSYKEPGGYTLVAARSVVEAELAEGAATPEPEVAPEPESEPEPEAETPPAAEIGHEVEQEAEPAPGLPPPPPREI